MLALVLPLPDRLLKSRDDVLLLFRHLARLEQVDFSVGLSELPVDLALFRKHFCLVLLHDRKVGLHVQQLTHLDTELQLEFRFLVCDDLEPRRQLLERLAVFSSLLFQNLDFYLVGVYFRAVRVHATLLERLV